MATIAEKINEKKPAEIKRVASDPKNLFRSREQFEAKRKSDLLIEKKLDIERAKLEKKAKEEQDALEELARQEQELADKEFSTGDASLENKNNSSDEE